MMNSLIFNIQRALYNLLYLEKEKFCNGKLFDVSGITISAIKLFRNEEGTPQKKGEPLFNVTILNLLSRKLEVLSLVINSSQIAQINFDPFNEGFQFTNSLNLFLSHHGIKHETSNRHLLQKLIPENNYNLLRVKSSYTNVSPLVSISTRDSFEKVRPHHSSATNRVPVPVQNQIDKLNIKLQEQEKELELYKSKFQSLSREYTEVLDLFKTKSKILYILEERLEIYQKNYHKSEYKMSEMKDKIIQYQEILADYRQKVVELEGMTRQITNKSSLVKKIGIKVLETFVILILKFVVFIGWILKLFKIVSKGK